MKVEDKAHERANALYPGEGEHSMLLRQGYQQGYLAAQPQWLPIEQAPKDGTKILALYPLGVIELVYCENDRWWLNPSTFIMTYPLLFQPIPALP